MKKIKGWNKLIIQILLLSISMIALSFITDTQVWLDYFNTKVIGSEIYQMIYEKERQGCTMMYCQYNLTTHYHWNYRGYVYFFTGFIFFIISIARIINSHDEIDFKKQ